jgi:chaperonin GroES
VLTTRGINGNVHQKGTFYRVPIKEKIETKRLNKEELSMKLVPLFDRVVLKQLVAEETTKSGIVLPGQAKEKPQQAEVIAVGPGGVVDGKEVTMQVKTGDKVIFSKYSGTEVEVDEEKYVVVKQNDILAVIE